MSKHAVGASKEARYVLSSRDHSNHYITRLGQVGRGGCGDSTLLYQLVNTFFGDIVYDHIARKCLLFESIYTYIDTYMYNQEGIRG